MARAIRVIDIADMPEVARLVEEARRTDTTLALSVGDEALATLSPARSSRRRRKGRQFIDTSALPEIPYRTVDEVMTGRPAWTGRAFTDEEIATALEAERVQAWRRTSS